MSAGCIFCRIIRGELPSHRILETSRVFAFLDINPLSKGHALVIPKSHATFMHEVPDEELAELLPAAKRIVHALNLHQTPNVGGEIPDKPLVSYNILQNNGRMAHQAVDHVHFHIIPRPDTNTGLQLEWNVKPLEGEELKQLAEKIRATLEAEANL
ncbi:hypothetical protein H696_01669 [Fonticula alba]|uniref:HIT domain-containing protein n=1 Tax=Fonticula alba TaxID=691883 RepID=A0A058ZFM0_FONAL|nr:hypothetical protein H696_01669 [Fonticula alba]KCV72272.1 hypothetical protein H696_01669 [Fonticula alba]|eukprot:XP_009493850.1 hypothetical protein H696_01669 [Fonticula alba]